MRNVLTFLRRTRHVVSVMAFALATAVLAAQSQPAKQIQAGRGQPSATAQNKSDPVPPINITVTTPDKSTDEKAAERQRSERQDAMNQRIAKFTFWLVIVGAIQAVATMLAFAAAWSAAGAAKKSADVAERSLLHLNRAYLTTERWTVAPDYFGGTVKISFEISNPSKTAARLERIELTIGSNTTTREIRTMIAPNERYPLTETTSGITVPPIDGYGAAQSFSFEVSGRIAYTDIFHKTRHRRFARSVVCPHPHGVNLGMPDVPGANDEEDWNHKD